MPPVLLAYLTSAAAYAGFQWTVQLVVYPQFPAVPQAAFAQYERRHQRRITVLVAPLFAALLVSVGWLLLDRPPQTGLWAVLLGAGLLGVILGTTAFGAVAMHRRLSNGWDETAYRTLLRIDLVRALAATAQCALAVVLITR